MKSNKIDMLMKAKPECTTDPFGGNTCKCVACKTWIDNLYQSMRNGEFLRAINEKRREMNPSQRPRYEYALTLNAGSTDPLLVERIWQKVLRLKPFRHVSGFYVYEVYDKERKITYPHVHAFIQTDSYINVSDVQKTAKCSLKMDRLKTPIDVNKWVKYCQKDLDHQPTKDWFLQHGFLKTTNSLGDYDSEIEDYI